MSEREVWIPADTGPFDEDLSGFDIATTRALAYRIMSACLLPPDDERISSLTAAIPTMEAIAIEVGGLTVLPPWERLVAAVRDASPEQWLVEYTSMFLSGSISRGVPPYESSYVVPVGDMHAPAISAEVEVAYRSAGLVLGGRFTGEFPDHIATELDFMAVLCDREADADNEEEARNWRAIQSTFLREHPARWFGAFARRVAASAPNGVCACASDAAQAFVEHDQALLLMLA